MTALRGLRESKKKKKDKHVHMCDLSGVERRWGDLRWTFFSFLFFLAVFIVLFLWGGHRYPF